MGPDPDVIARTVARAAVVRRAHANCATEWRQCTNRFARPCAHAAACTYARAVDRTFEGAVVVVIEPDRHEN